MISIKYPLNIPWDAMSIGDEWKNQFSQSVRRLKLQKRFWRNQFLINKQHKMAVKLLSSTCQNMNRFSPSPRSGVNTTLVIVLGLGDVLLRNCITISYWSVCAKHKLRMIKFSYNIIECSSFKLRLIPSFSCQLSIKFYISM